ncbi:hypothetical protein E4634_18260 [Mangrovimicrobium sediminis]|uniref:Phosphatidate cytidylyltransferase n=1 Tax=Mangrovimicrobium sediminis TaxID=2562682 RepID=A0A4Z0LWX9_9GAMM|nr:hypothetical protein [Haliea sp. SAOS-164]TGD71585.1 hypothetical protein E4634_18260 [Haliea sp. SAOS-164]
MLDALRARHNDAIGSILLYGSCLRSGDLYDGLLDLYLVCDSYSSAYDSRLTAAANWMLPPNVFYAEQRGEGGVLRAKVTVISARDFRRGCSTAWFESYIWGRFAQPTRVVFSRDARARETVEQCLLQASRTLLHNALPALPAEGDLAGLWERALALSYGTELRTERAGRATELAQAAREFYAQLSRQHADSLGFPFVVYDSDGTPAYRCEVGGLRRRISRLAWWLRKAQGKLLSVLRLLKALFTFEGGLDYIAWKLERHSGEEITIPDRVRRAPLIFLWGFFWDLYRRGIFK